MATRLDRLKQRADFLRIAALRRKWAAPGLILQAAPGTETDPQADSLRVGFTVSKKVGNSVCRNRAKRRLRAAVDAIFPSQAALGLDYVVIGRRETLERPYSLLLQDLQAALKRVGGLRTVPETPPKETQGEA
ncbi:ribonuclease P protein component [Paramagnetospirillum kuznetsovii]|uniref:Ribonuclease P protein component n=1 Tax=Paramagnetospirillum kuznetsovii TaxID=2053833 RepID=A0A364P440_9PROT|nr:ribonuclease P protein component [Paramagnetospirillum kuznetsovii]RAU23885.1 ribonuclease P protein component [Paramagnetospirillum kuznetsovii]